MMEKAMVYFVSLLALLTLVSAYAPWVNTHHTHHTHHTYDNASVSRKTKNMSRSSFLMSSSALLQLNLNQGKQNSYSMVNTIRSKQGTQQKGLNSLKTGLRSLTHFVGDHYLMIAGGAFAKNKQKLNWQQVNPIAMLIYAKDTLGFSEGKTFMINANDCTKTDDLVLKSDTFGGSRNPEINIGPYNELNIPDLGPRLQTTVTRKNFKVMFRSIPSAVDDTIVLYINTHGALTGNINPFARLRTRIWMGDDAFIRSKFKKMLNGDNPKYKNMLVLVEACHSAGYITQDEDGEDNEFVKLLKKKKISWITSASKSVTSINSVFSLALRAALEANAPNFDILASKFITKIGENMWDAQVVAHREWVSKTSVEEDVKTATVAQDGDNDDVVTGRILAAVHSQNQYLAGLFQNGLMKDEEHFGVTKEQIDILSRLSFDIDAFLNRNNKRNILKAAKMKDIDDFRQRDKNNQMKSNKGNKEYKESQGFKMFNTVTLAEVAGYDKLPDVGAAKTKFVQIIKNGLTLSAGEKAPPSLADVMKEKGPYFFGEDENLASFFQKSTPTVT